MTDRRRPAYLFNPCWAFGDPRYLAASRTEGRVTALSIEEEYGRATARIGWRLEGKIAATREEATKFRVASLKCRSLPLDHHHH